MPEDELRKYRERFLPKTIEVNVDGRNEVWVYETNQTGESKLFVTYRLKRTGKYKTGV